MISFPKISKVILNIVIINVLVFVAVYMTPIATQLGLSTRGLVELLCFNFPHTSEFKVHQIVTHFFMHDGIGYQGQISYRHLLYNMIGLYFLGTYVEQYLRPKKFLQLYVYSALGGLLAHVLVGYLTQDYTPVLGASGAVLGVVIAYATLFPNQSLIIFPIPIPIKAKWLAIGYIAYDMYNGLGNANTGIAHFAHLGGALTGFLCIKYWQTRR